MKALLLSVVLTLSFSVTHAQSWVHTNASRGSFGFDTPASPSYYYDSLYTSLHQWIKSDSTIMIQVHYSDSARINYGAGDPYVMFAQSLVYNTNGTLESNQSITAPTSKSGKEIGVSYTNPKNHLQFMFVRVFFFNDKIYSFSITAEQSNLSTLLSYKTLFFGSISIN